VTVAAAESPTATPSIATVDSDGPLLHAPVAKPQWMHYGDHIRILGTIAVVVGHVSDMVLYREPALSHAWWVCNGYDAAVRWAVPIYIMLSGALLLDPARGETPSVFYRKRLSRLGVPIVFWSAFFMWFSVDYTGWVPNWGAAWLNLLKGEPYVHMHFIFRIAGLYAFTPMLRVFVRHAPRPMVVVTVVLLLCVSAADTVANNFTETELSLFFRFVPFLGYYLFGYLLREGARSRRTVVLCWAGLVVSIAVLCLGTGWTVDRFIVRAGRTTIYGPPSLGMMLYDFVSPVRVVMAICAWVVLVNLFRDPWPHSKTGRSAIRFWANTTLGLYLIHPLFRELWWAGLRIGSHPPLIPGGVDATHFGQTPMNVWVGVPVVAALVYVPALLATVLLMRIPGVRRITG